MAISIKRTKNERGVKLGSLHIGDTFLYDNRVGVMIDRNGHAFPLDLTTCSNFRRNHYGNTYSGGELDNDVVVLPIEIEMTYKVVG